MRIHKGDLLGLGNLIPYGYPIPKSQTNEIMETFVAPHLGDTWASIREFFLCPPASPTT